MPHPTKPRLPRWSLLPVVILALISCASPQEIVAAKEDNLSAAGFLIRPANTPERLDMLHRLPPARFVRRAQGDDISYVFADPLVCNCLYVGNQTAYNNYRLHMQQQRLVDQQQLIADTYSDASWNWGIWRPGYGAFGPGFGFAPGW